MVEHVPEFGKVGRSQPSLSDPTAAGSEPEIIGEDQRPLISVADVRAGNTDIIRLSREQMDRTRLGLTQAEINALSTRLSALPRPKETSQRTVRRRSPGCGQI